ncbi:MAG: hypothetical protein ACR2H1_04215, partial [Limisphaerales bacterium]
AVHGIGTSILGTFLYGGFSAFSFWIAFNKKLIFHDENGQLNPHQKTGHVVFFVLALFCLYGCGYFLLRLKNQLHKPKN